MSEENSVSSSNSALSPAEFNFSAPPTRNRRIRTPRSLKGKPAEPADTAAPLDQTSTDPLAGPVSRVQHEDPAIVAISPTEVSAARPNDDLPERVAHIAPIEPSPTSAALPEEDRSTRPTTLYYSDAASLPPKKTSSTIRSTRTFTAAKPDDLLAEEVEPAPAAKAGSFAGYRQNIERQTREQKSVGNILSTVVYLLVALTVIGSLLAGYGLWSISQRLEKQSLTLAQLDQHYAAETQNLALELKQEQTSLAAAQAALAGQGDALKAQREELARLRATTDAAAQSQREANSEQASELAALRYRIRLVERGLAKIPVKATTTP